ncbi:ABC transporter substrate-binding protein [Calidifontibacillus oryziterrae]|uniref:ABC transporter substrate-binding protein n=1 Tax=Calidifontibacillus oryziterrae TaxID=1191699 RepID=UPI000304F0DB|nr:ABC transporter substrate-binding protein [Calidifontibacillus oryziterrae]
MLLKKSLFFLLCFVTIVVLSSCSNTNSEENQVVEKESEERIIEDMAGRKVSIPTDINRIYTINEIGTIFLYTLAPEKLAGWNSKLGSEKPFIKEEFHDLPVLGRWRGPDSVNIEEILGVNPDIIINMGDVSEGYISESNEMEELFGVPVIMVDGSLTKQDEAYLFLGDLLGVKERAKVLADYSREILDRIEQKAKSIQPSEKLRVYYAAGTEGLETVPMGSINTEIIDVVGGINVAGSNLNENVRRMQVSLEHVIDWNPNMIIISSSFSENHEVYHTILSDRSWSHIDAVQNQHVYEIPYGPYDWFNGPPSVMRIMGLQWLGNLLYPNVYDIDLKKELIDFMKVFFEYEISDEEINALLERAVRQ